MSLVWRKIQRSNKRAAKFKFTANFQELMIQCSEKWQPTKISIAWSHRRRRYATKAYRWEPTITDPYRGLIVWPDESETLEIVTTLYRDLRNENFEDKEWTFVVEEITTKGKFKPIAATEVKLKLRPLTDHVKSCIMQLVLTSAVLKEGDALEPTTEENEGIINTAETNQQISEREQKLSSNDSGFMDLLGWCQEVTKPYRQVKVTEFSKSWRNGMAFCAIIHYFRPDLIDFDSLKPSDIRGNCRLAFDTAVSLGVPKLLDANDMVIMQVPDKIAVISYVHALRDHFTGKKGSGVNTPPATKRNTSGVSSVSREEELDEADISRHSLLSLDALDAKVFAEFERFRHEREEANAVYESGLTDYLQENRDKEYSGVKWRNRDLEPSSSKSPTPEKVGHKKKKKKHRDRGEQNKRKSPRKSADRDSASSGGGDRSSAGTTDRDNTHIS